MDALPVSPKVVFGVCFAVMCLIEIARGFLKPFLKYCASIKPKPFLLIFLLALNAALFLLPFDQLLRLKIQSVQNSFVDSAIRTGAYFGRSQGMWSWLAAVYFIALIFRSRKFQELAFGAVLSSALTGLLAHILKMIAMRARPYVEVGPYHFFDFHGWMENVRAFQSFPSGDSAICSGAAVFLFFSFRRFYFGWIFLLLPFLTALSRIDLNKHWPSDTVFSFIVSFAVARFVLDYLKYRESNR